MASRHAGLEIFVDEEFRPGGPSGMRQGGAAGAEGVGGWAQLGSFEQTRKENQQQAGQWAGVGTVLHAVMPLSDPHGLLAREWNNGDCCTQLSLSDLSCPGKQCSQKSLDEYACRMRHAQWTFSAWLHRGGIACAAAGARLKQKRALVAPPAPPLDNPTDPELAGGRALAAQGRSLPACRVGGNAATANGGGRARGAPAGGPAAPAPGARLCLNRLSLAACCSSRCLHAATVGCLE